MRGRPPADRDTVASQLLEHVHVLVVDEDAGVRERVERIVGDHGGVATSAPTAQRAVDFSSVIRPSVVISDLRLANGKSGVWLLDELQAGPLARVPVIAMGRASTDEELATTLPFSAFIAKPVDAHELCALILGVVDRRVA
jgi:DNA-binding NtrC family response regulator